MTTAKHYPFPLSRNHYISEYGAHIILYKDGVKIGFCGTQKIYKKKGHQALYWIRLHINCRCRKVNIIPITYLHTMVAHRFINNSSLFNNQIDHRDGNQWCNLPDNLEWVDDHTNKMRRYHPFPTDLYDAVRYYYGNPLYRFGPLYSKYHITPKNLTDIAPITTYILKY